jgi:hypothetical protein
MAASLVYFLLVSRFVESNERRLAVVALLTLITWIAITFLTRPEKPEVLESFYARIRPGGGGWRPIAERLPGVDVDRNLLKSLAAAFLATGVVYLTIPGIGNLIFGQAMAGAFCLVGAIACAALAYLLVMNVGWEKIVR